MIRYLLDTNIVIYTMNNRPPAVREAFERHQDSMAVSTITIMELFYGADCSRDPERNRRVIEGFTARLAVLDYDDKAASHTAQIRAVLKPAGKPIGPYDAMIAGHARSQGLVVVTNNTSEFERVPGLQVSNWL